MNTEINPPAAAARTATFSVMPADAPQRLHDALKAINRQALYVRGMVSAALSDPACAGSLQPDIAEALADIARTSELQRRELNKLLADCGPFTITIQEG